MQATLSSFAMSTFAVYTTQISHFAHIQRNIDNVFNGFDIRQYAISNVVNDFDNRQNQTDACWYEFVHVRNVVFFHVPNKYPDKTI